jgi:RNA polymerase sigma-70 factor (ECF subfamily)
MATGDAAAATAVDAVATATVPLIASLRRDQHEAVLLRAVLGLDTAVLGKRPCAARTCARHRMRALTRHLETRSQAAGGVTQPRSLTLKDMR